MTTKKAVTISNSETEISKPNPSPIEMIRTAKEAGVEPKDLQGFLDVQINWEKREAEKAFNDAMARVHAGIPLVIKSGQNPQTRSKYAELDHIISATKDVYTKEGFSVSFYEGENAPQGHVRICADILHRLGHKQTRHIDVPLDGVGIKGNANMTAIHAKASSTSYGRRYLMCMIFNIPTGDDDGNGAGNPVEFIDEKQQVVIRDYLVSLEVPEEKFLKWANVESLDFLPKSQYQKAIKVLKEREAKK